MGQCEACISAGLVVINHELIILPGIHTRWVSLPYLMSLPETETRIVLPLVLIKHTSPLSWKHRSDMLARIEIFYKMKPAATSPTEGGEGFRQGRSGRVKMLSCFVHDTPTCPRNKAYLYHLPAPNVFVSSEILCLGFLFIKSVQL